MQPRTATPADFAAILALQEKNLVSKLTEEQKKEGFVTTPFTVDQLQEILAMKGLFVIEEGAEIKGYTMAAGWDFFAQWPIFPHMLQRFNGKSFNAVMINAKNSFQYGPICVDHSVRGSSAFPDLFARMKQDMLQRFAVGTTFINKKNGRSFAAHTKKLGLQLFDEFSFNNNDYWVLAFTK